MDGRALVSYSAHAQLAEVRMRLDAIDIPAPAALLVEGPDDKRLFLPFARHPALVVPCAGKERVLAVAQIMTTDDKRRMLALVDCDFDVARGSLQLQPELVVTKGTDVEADMLQLGLLDRIVQHLIPKDMSELGELSGIANKVLEAAFKLATPLGRARMAAQPLGVPLALEVFPFSKYMLSSGELDVEKLIKSIHNRLAGIIGLAGFRALYEATPDDRRICKGDDLLAAVAFILRKEYRASNKTNPDMITLMLRTCMSDRAVFEAWSVVQRIRICQQRNGTHLLLEVN